jgi:hypothetical protein
MVPKLYANYKYSSTKMAKKKEVGPTDYASTWWLHHISQGLGPGKGDVSPTLLGG